jgi:hypothetical protein
MRNLGSNKTRNGKGHSSLILRTLLSVAVFPFMAITAPKAHADTLPTACVSTNHNCPLITQAPPELNYANDAANITGLRFGSDVKVYSELVDNTAHLSTARRHNLAWRLPTTRFSR